MSDQGQKPGDQPGPSGPPSWAPPTGDADRPRFEPGAGPPLFPQEKADEKAGRGTSATGTGYSMPTPPPTAAGQSPPPASGRSFNAGAKADAAAEALSTAGIKARSSFVHDPGSWVAAAVSITVLVLILAGFVLAGSTYAGIGTVFLLHGARARLIALASFATLDVATVLLVAAVLARVVTPQEPVHFRRLALLGVAALSALVAVAAAFRGLVLLTFVGTTVGGSFHGFLSALAVVPIAGVAALLASALVEGPGPHR